MATAIRSHDWTATSLGPVEHWPFPLRNAIELCLSSPLAAFVWWGRDLVQIHNDAALALVRTDARAALGVPAREAWSEAWGIVGPLAERVLGTGEAQRAADVPVASGRGSRTASFFTLLCTPLRDQSGEVAGLFVTAVETTGKVQAEARQAFLLRLSDTLRELANPRLVKVVAAELLARYLRADRAGYAEVDAAEAMLTFNREWCAPGMPSLAGRRRLDDIGPRLLGALRGGHTVAFADSEAPSLRDVVPVACRRACTRAAIIAPLLRNGQLVAALYVHQGTPRSWSWEEEALVLEVAQRTSAAIERARAEVAQRDLLATLDLGTLMARDLDDTITFWSGGCERLYGWSAAEVLGRRAHELLRTVFPVPRSEVNAALEARGEWTGDVRQRARDGREMVVTARKTLRRDAEGRPAAVLESLVDATAQRRAEAARGESEARLRLFIERAPAAIAMFDADLCYLAASRRYLSDYGLPVESPDALIGRCHREVFPDLPERWHALHRRVLAGETLSAEDDPFPRATGEVEWVRWEMTPWRRADGTVGGVLLFSEVVTTRRRAEQALRQSEATLNAVLDALPVGVILADAQGRIVRDNAANRLLWGGAPETADWATYAEWIGYWPETGRRIRAEEWAMTRALLGGEVVTGELVECERFDTAERRFFLNNAAPVRDEAGRIIGGVAAELDVTEARRSERALQESEARLKELQTELLHVSRLSAAGEMVAALAHELNQPLTAIANYLKGCRRLLETTADPSALSLRDAVAEAAEQALRAGQIIRRLRVFVARGESEYRLEDLSKLVEEATALAFVGAKERGARVSHRFDAAAGLVVVDRIQIQQVLLNLIRNAVEAMEDAPRRELAIATRAEPGEGVIEVSVADTGPGIPAEIAARLFSPFVTTKKQGMGVGLSICRTIVEAHGGRIWVQSEPGAGTVFRFTLPDAGREGTDNVS